MSLKNTPDSAEKLATNVNLVDLTNFISYANNIKTAWLWDYSKDVLIVMDAIKLLTEWLVYAFRIEDDYSESLWGNSDGVYLYRRTWKNTSINILSWENISLWTTWVPTDEDAIRFLIENQINHVITWPIIWEFLWIEWSYIDWDWDARSMNILSESSISEMRENGIDVTILDRLL